MTADSDFTPQQRIRDWLFERLGGESSPAPPDLEGIATSAGQDLSCPSPMEASSGPPAIRREEDLQAANAWLQRERQRLEDYTRGQLNHLQQQQHAFVQQTALNQQAMILRSQELARQEELLLAQGQFLRQQNEDLMRREQALAEQYGRWCEAQKEAAALQEVKEQVHQETDAQRSLLAALQAETASLQGAQKAAQVELDHLLGAIAEQRTARAREEELLRTKQEQLDQRLNSAERAELACQQRLAELDDLEAHLRKELAEQEGLLRRERRELDAFQAHLREATRKEQAHQAARQTELDRRLNMVEQLEKASKQRENDLDCVEARLAECCETLTDHQAAMDQREQDLERREQQICQQLQERAAELAEQWRELELQREQLERLTPVPGHPVWSSPAGSDESGSVPRRARNR
jgi:hypothetical protein